MFRPTHQPSASQTNSDSDLEKKRLKALKSRQARIKAKEYEEQLRHAILDATEQVEKLKEEKDKLIEEITTFENSLTMQRLVPARTDLCSSSSVGDKLPFSVCLPHAPTDNSCQKSTKDVSFTSPFLSASSDLTECEPSSPNMDASGNISWESLHHQTEGRLCPDLSSMTLYESPPLSHWSQNSPAVGTSISLPHSLQEDHDAPPTKKASRRRQSTVAYRLPPQDDPELETKRQRAIRAHQHRQQQKILARELQMNIQKKIEDVESLKVERERILMRLEELQEQYDQTTGGRGAFNTKIYNKSCQF